MVSRDIIQRLLAIINDTRARVNTLEAREVVLRTSTQTLTNKTLTTPTIGDYTNAQHAHTNAASGGTVAHGSLIGLTTGDPHTQYALLAGRIGGQSFSGGTAANDDLTLQGTTNATRTTSYVLLQPNGGDVGIGTTTPDTRLQVVSTTGSQVKFTTTGVDSNSGIQLVNDAREYGILVRGDISDNFTIRDTNAGVDRMVINTSGDVGIGTTTPVNKLQVVSTTGSQVKFTTTGVDSNSGIQLVNDAREYGILVRGDISDNFTIRDTNAGVDRMVINTSGDVGIGTTSPDTRLDIDAGAIEFAEMTAPAAGAANTGRLFCRDNTSGKTQLCVIFNTGAIQVIATEP